MARLLLALSVACYVLATSYGQDVDCSPAQSCDACIQLDRRCGWCKNLQRSATTRCQLATQFNLTGDCIDADVSGPKTTSDVPLVNLTEVRNPTVNLAMRPRASVTFSISITRQADFPIDLYYVLDITQRMGFNLNSLRRTGPNIIQQLAQLTPNRRIGLGVFSDKPTSPFFNTKIDGTVFQSPQETNECGIDEGGRNTACGPVNSFQHILPLTDNITAYTAAVNTTLLTTKPSEDDRHGQLDALLQAAVCDAPGWNTFELGGAIRLIVLATDGPYHSAGDGLLGGILRWNDGQCHLDSAGFYDYSLLQDYPSTGQVKDALDANEIIVLFAVAGIGGASVDLSIYEHLVRAWGGRGLSAELPNDDTAFVNIVVNAAREASEQANVQLSRAAEGVTVTATATCPSGSPLNPGATLERCNGMTVGKTATFEVTVTADDCSKLVGTTSLRLSLSPAYGSVALNINPLCTCPCSSMSVLESPACNRLGALTCGKCFCPASHAGSTCACDINEVRRVSNESECQAPTSGVGDLPCSGNGRCTVTDECRFGCTCNPGFHGKFCACQNSALCPLSRGLACGGTNRGRCLCENDIDCTDCKCNCIAPFIRTAACDFCDPSPAGCQLSTSFSAVCSANGNCTCGECQCNSGYTGDRCQFCNERVQSCPTVCARALACALGPPECAGAGNATATCYDCGMGMATTTRTSATCTVCPPIRIIQEPTGASFPDPTNPNGVTEGTSCSATDGNCQNTYYTAQDNNLVLLGVVRVARNEERDCSQAFNSTPVVLGIVFGLLGLAILLLVIWKVVTTFLDRREYRHFLEAQKNAKWEKESNPLFKSPTQTFVNPDYKGTT